MDTMVEKPAKKTKSKREGETSRAKFLRLAPPRMEAALKKLSLIGNLAGSGYEYEASEIKQIVATLTEAVSEIEAKFNNKKSGRRGGFSFKKGGAE